MGRESRARNFMSKLNKIFHDRTSLTSNHIPPLNCEALLMMISYILSIHLAPNFTTVQKEVSDLLKGKILVGHALHHDLKVCLLFHSSKFSQKNELENVIQTVNSQLAHEQGQLHWNKYSN